MSTREVQLGGASPWGFRMTGGADVALSLRISRVNPGSKAAAKGVREGDLITSINNQPTKNLTNAESHALLRTIKENLLLGLNQDPDASPKRKGIKEKQQGQVESPHLPPHLPSTDSTNNKGEKKTTAKLRQKRRRFKSRIRWIFGLDESGKRDEKDLDQQDNKSTEGSERSWATRTEDINSECRSDTTSARLTEDNSSLVYDNDFTNEQIEKSVETCEVKISHDVNTNRKFKNDLHNLKLHEKDQEMNYLSKSDPKNKTNFSEVFITCNEYLIGAENKGRHNLSEGTIVPPDIILTSNKQQINIIETDVTKQVFERNRMNHYGNKPSCSNNSEEINSLIKIRNDLNNNKSRNKKQTIYSSDKLSAKRVYIFHSPDECEIGEVIYDIDGEQNTNDSVGWIPERAVNLCKANVSFEDGVFRSIDANVITRRSFIILEDDISLLSNPPQINLQTDDEVNNFQDINYSKSSSSVIPMYYVPVRRCLDVIKEEPSDISSDGEKPKDLTSLNKNNKRKCMGQEHHPDGIDTSWRDGKSLDDMSDVPIASDSLSDTDLLMDDSKPPKSPSPAETKKYGNQLKVYPHTSNSKPSLSKPKVPSVNVVRSVIASYYNDKSKTIEIENIKTLKGQICSEEVHICPSSTEKPSLGEDVEVVFIDSSDSDALSFRSDQMVNSTSSNRSSLEVIEDIVEEKSSLLKETSKEINKEPVPKVIISTQEFQPVDKVTFELKEDENKKYSAEIIELSQIIISEIAENLSSGANSRITSARSTPCKLLSARSTPSKEVDHTKLLSLESSKHSVRKVEDENVKFSPNSLSTSSHSTAKFVTKQIPSLKQLSAEVIFDLPYGRSLIKEIGLDYQNSNYDSSSDYFPETSEYSEQSRFSFASTDEVSGHRSQSELISTDLEKPVSSSTSSIVFISSPGKVLSESWLGMPLSQDSRLFACFSPSQLKSNPIIINQQKASELFDLHTKFIQRRGYHEATEFKFDEPDLISSENNKYNEKCRYDPETLSESANLLILEKYLKNRCNTNKTVENSNICLKDKNIERNELNLGCSGDDHKGETKCISEHNEEVGSSRLLELIQKEEVESSTSSERSMLVEKSTPGTTATTISAPPSFDSHEYDISKRGDIAIRKNKSLYPDKDRPISLPPSGEVFRRTMYEEYMNKVAERIERRQMKVIKVSDSPSNTEVGTDRSKQLEAEFMDKVRERMEKLGLKEDENDEDIEEPILDKDDLPKHLKEFVEILNDESGVWSPAGTPEAERKKFDFSEGSSKKEERKEIEEEDAGAVIWTPRSAGASPQLDRKKYKPINYQSPPPQRKNPPKQDNAELPKELPSRIVSSTSEGSTLANQTSKLPPAQNPVITLLQKAREGHIPKGAQYLENFETRSELISEATVGQHEIRYSVKKEYESDSEDKKKIVELSPRKFEGIGPTTKEGTPIALRSEVKEDNQQKWYKRMYESLHKADHDNLLPYTGWSSGYLSEPDRLYYDSDASFSSKYATLDRRRAKSTRDTTTSSDYLTSTVPRNIRYSSALRHPVNIYKNQPGRIEDYEPGHSSIADKEKQQWLDEVMDIFDGEFVTHPRSENSAPLATGGSSGKSFTSIFKEGGYDSDSTLVFTRREGSSLFLEDPKMAYKIIQKGGDIPLHGLRKPAPSRPKEPARPRNYVPSYTPSPESGREYIESEVNIHYKTPVRVEHKEYIEEGELARRQAEALRRIYQQQRRNKYLAELNDIHARRHQDYFTPSQKSPIPLNRYDDFPVEVAPPRPRDRTPEPKLVARALYNFLGQSSRELSFRRGDIIFVRRQIDKNWYEGEHNAMIGLFPINYVEIIPYDGIRTLPKKSTEGQARAKFNFQAQTHLELSLVKGELVLLTRRVDENWFEGRIGNKKGIFPVSYVQVLVEPGEVTYGGGKPVVTPASHSIMLNGAKDIGSQQQPPRPPSVGSPMLSKEQSQISQLLHIDSRSDPVPYRAMYNYKPQNDDELELREGDVVYVMEKCDDGWYVGSLHRNGQFGTFPGNYVQRIP